jgi:DNA helicase-2/ATP-dependent DNA helicase PcrA
VAARNPAAGRLAELVAEARSLMDASSIAALLEWLLDRSGLLEQYRVDTEEERLENLQELVKSVRLYEEDNRNEEDLSLQTYLQDVALYTNADYRKDDDKVKLMTIHQAKGLEFPAVWIYGLNEGVLPSHRTVRERGEAGLEEERRLMYVACTRAMDRLYLSDSEGFNVQNSLSKYPSRFIREAADECGPLYDIDGPFSQELWRGTDRLIAGLEAPAPPSVPGFAAGARVKHSVFGPGTVLEFDPDAGTVRVRFDTFGIRRLAGSVLEDCENENTV